MSVIQHTFVDISAVISEARGAEMCASWRSLAEVMAPVWPDLAEDPDFEDLEGVLRAEMLRLSGWLLHRYGRAHGLKNYQIRAKDLLTRAAEMFEAENEPEKTADALVSLANCYWYLGEIEEYEVILNSIQTSFPPHHPAAIRLQLNKLVYRYWKGNITDSIDVVAAISPHIDQCPDLRDQAQFHNLAGISWHELGETHKCIEHFSRATEICRELGNEHLLGTNLNQLAMAYRQLGNYAEAHRYIDESFPFLDAGWVPHLLDTRALVYLSEGKPLDALAAIDEAISLFSTTEDYGGLTAAMFTKCKCLLRLGKTSEAMADFAQIGVIARDRIGETAVRRFSELMAQELAPQRIDQKIYRIQLNGKKIFNGFTPSLAPMYFTVAGENILDLPTPAILLVDYIKHPVQGMPVLVENESLEIHKVKYDEAVNLYFLDTAEGPIWMDDTRILGTIAGWGPLEQAQGEIVTFQKI